MDKPEGIEALHEEIAALRAKNRELEAALAKAEQALKDRDAPHADLLERTRELSRRTDNIIASVPGVVWEQPGFASTTIPGSFVSDHITAMTGYTPEEVVTNQRFWTEIVHPEDREEALREFTEVLAKGSGTQQTRWITKDGRVIWVEGKVRVVRDEAGEIVGAYGVTMDITARKLAEQEHTRVQEELIRAQAVALEELSTPLIPISAEVMVMPLVGNFDERRADRVITTLLDGISRARARVAIIDITGVASVDTQTADALIRAARAVQLLGARVVLTGVRPEVAQTLVALGTDLGGIATHGTLESAIAYATRR